MKRFPISNLFLLASLPLGPLAHADLYSGPAGSPPPATGPFRLDPYVVTTYPASEALTVRADPKAPAQPMPAHDGADFLKAIPGFSVIRKGGTDGDPLLRGMAGSRLGILLDNEALYGGCGNRMDPPTAYVFPAAYDAVTVIKGPQTVLHGPGNSAGVVLFERTLRRPAAPVGDLQTSLTGGSFGRLDVLLDARAAAPAFQVRATGTATRADDQKDGAGARMHSAYERWSANASAAWTPDALTTIEVTGARSDGEAAYADRAMDGVAFDRTNAGLRARRERLAAWFGAVEVRAFRNYVDHVMDNFTLRPFRATAMMPNPSVSNPDRLTRGGALLAELQPAAAVSVTAGIDAQDNRHTVRSSMNEPLMPYAAQARTRDARFAQRGLFAEGAWSLPAPGGRLVAGARSDAWKAEDARRAVALGMMGSMPNPDAGRTRRSDLGSGFLRYEQPLRTAAGTVLLYAGAGRAQRFPDYWEAIKNESAGTVSAFGTRPETTTQLDVGAVARFAAFELSASVFAADIQDFILVQGGVAKPSGMAGTRTAVITRNVDAATRGGEFTATWRFAERWRLDGSLACVRGENDTDGRPLAQMPPLEGRLGLTYATDTWSAGGVWRAVAEQDRVALNQGNIVGQDLGRSPGFGVVSLHAGRRLGERWRLTGGVDNLFDKAYAEHLSRSGSAVPGFVQTSRVNEPGRTFWLRLDARY